MYGYEIWSYTKESTQAESLRELRAKEDIWV